MKKSDVTVFKKAIRGLSLLSLVALSGTLSACGNKNSTFSIMADGNSFKQSAATVNGKIDILFVVDNSGSMENSQKNLSENLKSFISQYDQKGYDYRIAVVTSDAYRVLYGAAASKAKFKDGTSQTGYTGVFVIDPQTPNLEATFMKNVLQGIYGSGDERVFQSMHQALISPQNTPFGFPRADAFLSVIIVSDEEDFSYDGSAMNESYSNPALHPVQKYVDFLDQVTGATEATRHRKYNVNTIAVNDAACKAILDTSFPRKIAKRLMELADKTKGIKGSLCDDFGPTLAKISYTSMFLASEFPLDGEPNPNTITVIVNNVNVPRVDPTKAGELHGYSYNADRNSITFWGNFIPQSGSQIKVTFDPMGLQ